jgi:hypothetical protein
LSFFTKREKILSFINSSGSNGVRKTKTLINGDIMKKFITILLFTLTLSLSVKAEFKAGSISCYDIYGTQIFTFGEFVRRGGWGQDFGSYDRTDFTPSFAEYLRSVNAFEDRRTGPYYIDYQNNYYHDNGHRTFIVGGSGRTSFLYVLKPLKKRVTLEVWKWSKRPHYGHVVLSGDELVFKEEFHCK